MIAVTSTLASTISRVCGLLGWYLTGISLVWGVILSTRLARRANLPAWLLGLHRSLAVGAAALLVVHVVAALGHHRVAIGVVDVVVPGHSQWRTGAITWGVVSLYLLLALMGTSVAITRMPRKWWHLSHLLAYPMFVTSAVHAWGASIDRPHRILLWTGLALVELTLVLALFRLWTHASSRARREAATATPST